jgi:putative membrane protein
VAPRRFADRALNAHFHEGKKMLRRSIPISAAAGMAVAMAPLCARAQSDPFKGDWGSHMMWWGGGWHGMFFGPLIMILVLVVVIGAVVLLVRSVAGLWHGQALAPRKPLDILKERFARGEIDKDEFEEKRRLLGD